MSAKSAPKPKPKSKAASEPQRSRADWIDAILQAGRAQSAATVMFHSALAAELGLSAVEEKALDLIERFGPLTAGELGKHAGLAPASVTGLVDRLELKGFARRAKDPRDARRVRVESDPGAIAAAGPLFDEFVHSLHELLAGYTVEQLATIHHFLTESARCQRAATAGLSSRGRVRRGGK